MIKQISLLFFAFSLLFSSFAFAQKTEETFLYTDRVVRKGYVKLRGVHFVKFETSKKAKAEKIDFSKLESVEIKNDDEAFVYKYVPIVGKDTLLVLEEIVKGAVTLYNLNTQGFSSGFIPGGMGGGAMYMGPIRYDIKNLYVLRIGEEKATPLRLTNCLRKTLKLLLQIF